MTSLAINAAPSAGTLAGGELIPVLKNGNPANTTPNAISTFISGQASSASTTRFVATRTELKALAPTDNPHASLGEAGRTGTFRSVLTSTLTAAQQAAVIADTAEGIFIPSGAYTWVREEFTGTNFQVGWFHNWSTTDLHTAVTVTIAVMQALETRSNLFINAFASRKFVLPAGDWTLSGRHIIGQGGIHLTSDGACTLTCTSDSEVFWFIHPDHMNNNTLNRIKVTGINFIRATHPDGLDIYLRLTLCRYVAIAENRFNNGTTHVQFESAQDPCFIYNNIFWHDDPAKTNAYSLKLKVKEVNPGLPGTLIDADNGKCYEHSSGVWFHGNQIRGRINDVAAHIYVEDIDGLQFIDNHLLNGRRQMEFQPIVHGVGRIANVTVSHNFFDGGTDTERNVYIHPLVGTQPLTARLTLRSNKFNHSSIRNVESDLVMEELHVLDNEFGVAKGAGMLRTEGGKGVCRIHDNYFRLELSASPTTDCIDIFMTDKQQFVFTSIRDNIFGDIGSGATYPPRAILLTGNPPNFCEVYVDGNSYNVAFALVLDTSGNNVKYTLGANKAFPLPPDPP